MATQSFYGDVEFKKAVTVVGKVTATAGTAAGELATKGQVDAAQAAASLRSNHTGTQPSSTISDFATAVDGRIDTKIATLVNLAPSDLDTLGEIASWIAQDETDTAALVATVSGHTTSITDLDTRVDALETGGGGGSFKADIGDGTASTFTLTHGLNTTDVMVDVFETAGNRQTVFPVITRISTTQVTVDFDGTVIGAGSHRVLIKGV